MTAALVPEAAPALTSLALAAGLAAAAAWAVTGPSGPSRRLRACAGSTPLVAEGAGGLLPVAVAVPWPLAGLGVGLLVAVVVGPAAGATVGVLAVAAARARRRAARRAEREALRAGQLAVCEALAAELSAGRPAVAALRAAAGAATGPAAELAGRAAGIAELGGDVASVLRGPAPAGEGGLRGGRRPGPGPAGSGAAVELFARLAACWTVSALSGGGLAAGVERLAAGLRAEERQRAELDGELAAARATARLLAVLPALGLLLGAAVGAEPVPFLLSPGWGAGCLLGAVLLDLAGLAWTERIAARAAAAGRASGPGRVARGPDDAGLPQ